MNAAKQSSCCEPRRGSRLNRVTRHRVLLRLGFSQLLSFLTYRFCNNYADWRRGLKSVQTADLRGAEEIVKPKTIDDFGSIYKSMERGLLKSDGISLRPALWDLDVL